MADDAIVGSTWFLDLEVFTWPPPWPPGVNRGLEPGPDAAPSVAEIGSTWYSASAQRNGINTEVKWLQLVHAFEVWGVLRVTLKTDAGQQSLSRFDRADGCTARRRAACAHTCQ